jgi:hypothetical protein
VITRWAHIEVWVQYDDPDDADNLFDAVADAAHDHEPEGYDCYVSGSLNAKPDWLNSGDEK